MSVSATVWQPGGPKEPPSLPRSGETAAGVLFIGLLDQFLGQYQALSCPEETAPCPDSPQPEGAEKENEDSVSFSGDTGPIENAPGPEGGLSALAAAFWTGCAGPAAPALPPAPVEPDAAETRPAFQLPDAAAGGYLLQAPPPGSPAETEGDLPLPAGSPPLEVRFDDPRRETPEGTTEPVSRLPSQPGESPAGPNAAGLPSPEGGALPNGPESMPQPQTEDAPAEEASPRPLPFREDRVDYPPLKHRGGGNRFPEEPFPGSGHAPGAVEAQPTASTAGTREAEPLIRPGGAGAPAGDARGNLVEQLGARIVYLREQGGFPAEMRLRLSPPALGEIAIRVSYQHGRLAVRFAAEASVQKLVESCLGELQQRLPQADLSVTRLAVPATGLSASFSSSAENGHPDQGRFFPAWTGGKTGNGRHDLFPEAAALPETAVGFFHRGINYWA